MAISIISGNLNTFGNAGQFETDPSTWGFSASGNYEISRSSVQKTGGLYSCRVRALTNVNAIFSTLFVGRVSLANTKKYLLKANIYVPSSSPIATADKVISFQTSGGVTYSVVENITKTVADVTDTWGEVSLKIQSNIDIANYQFGVQHSGGDSNTNGLLYVDQFEIYEYEDVPDVVVDCDVDIDETGTVVTNETTPGANNGSISVVATGTGTLEYSKDGVVWQLSNLFAGLTTGIYLIKVRQQAQISCVETYPFAVNHAATAFDFTTLTTDESVSGAHDGTLSITPAGAGGPFEFSIDAGVTWLGTNNFTDLAPGLYYVAVRDADGNAIVKLVTINAALVEFDNIYHSKNPVTLAKAAASGWEMLTNYRLYNDVRVEDVADSGNFNSKLKMELPPDASGNVVFYLRQAFRGIFTFVPPNLNDTEIIRLTDRIKRFKSYTGELTGTDTIPATLTPTVADLVIFGGIDKVHYPGLNYFTSYLPANKKFLTWAPVEKYVDRQQEDYLNFWVYGHYTQLKLKLKVYFDDNTNETSIVKTKTGVRFSELYQVPAGPANCGALLVNPAKTAIKYELNLLDQTDTAISEVRTYYINQTRHPLTRFFMFLNSLGAFETLLFTGQANEKTDIASDIIQKFLPADYSSLDGEFEVNNSNIQKKQSYSSGYVKGRLAKKWHEYLIDLLLSKRKYDVTSGSRIPIVLTGSDHGTQDQNYERYVRMEVKPAYDDDSFTPSSL